MTMAQTICLLRLSAIGDVCHTVPVLRTIQRAYPQARITWIIGRAEAGLVGDIPGLDFLVFDKKRSLRSLWQLRNSLAGRRFDILLTMQVSFRASLVCRLVKAVRTIGFDRQRSKRVHRLCGIRREGIAGFGLPNSLHSGRTVKTPVMGV
jgi:heptosyltransferase I